jgi:nitrous oxide reductase accessory protein NosL
MTIRLFVLITALAWSGGCRANAGGPPIVELDRTVCAQCGMLVSDIRFAAAYRDAGAEAKVFDDIGCLRKSARGLGNPGATAFWFHDAVDHGWIEGRGTVFVASTSLQTPMGGGYLAFRDAAAAGREAAVRRARVVASLDDLLRDADREAGQ